MLVLEPLQAVFRVSGRVCVRMCVSAGLWVSCGLSGAYADGSTIDARYKTAVSMGLALLEPAKEVRAHAYARAYAMQWYR